MSCLFARGAVGDIIYGLLGNVVVGGGSAHSVDPFWVVQRLVHVW